ncbi:MAG: restriction endonuclease subunit S [Stellaceae bacterium]
MQSDQLSGTPRWAYLPECERPAKGWAAQPFLNIARVVAGQSPPSDTYNGNGDGLPFLQGNANFTLRYPEPTLWCSVPSKCAQTGDTLISVRAPVGEVNRADRDYAIGRGLAAIRANRCDPDFLYHATQRWRWSLQRVAQGTTFDAVTARHFALLRVAAPLDHSERAAIARILDAVDTALECTREAIDRAQQLRASLLADLLRHGIGDNGKVRAHDDRSPEFVSAPAGRLPIVWLLSTVDKEFDLQIGFALNESRRPRYRKRRYLRVANVQRDALDLSDVQELEAGDLEFAPRVLARDDMPVVEGHADRMEIGRCARVTEAAAGMTFQNHLFRLRTKGAVVPGFACLWLNSAYAQRFWNARCATSSGLNTINQRSLKRLMMPVPSRVEQETIVKIIEQQRQHWEALLSKLSKLESLKKGLMHDLLTGRVRVNGLAEAGAA